MSSDVLAILTIASMAVVTYCTRLGGFLLLRNRALSPRTLAVLEAVPGCVLISVIAPRFVSDKPAELLALAITLLAAWRLPLLPTVIVSVVATGLLRHFM
jgi:uncharacterized membrane protein